MRITPFDIERFTCGDCHILARAINRLTGWPIHCFSYGEPAEPELHAFCIMPDGRVIDVEGVHNPLPFRRKWTFSFFDEDAGQQPLGFTPPVTFEEICKSWGSSEPTYGRNSIRRAREVARHLCRQFT